MPYFMIVFILYINLLNLSWIKKKSIFEEYGAFYIFFFFFFFFFVCLFVCFFVFFFVFVFVFFFLFFLSLSLSAYLLLSVKVGTFVELGPVLRICLDVFQNSFMIKNKKISLKCP